MYWWLRLRWWCLWCFGGVCLTCGVVLGLGQERTLGICDLLARKQAEQRRYFGDKRFKRFKEAITNFRGFNRVSPAKTWALYLVAWRSSLTSRFLTSPSPPFLRLEVLYDIWGPWPRGSETEKGAEIGDNQGKQGKGGDITEIRGPEIIQEIK